MKAPMNADRTPAPAGKESYNVVVGIDYSEQSEQALYAGFDAMSQRPGAELHVIAVAEGDGPRLPDELTADAKQRFLDEAAKTLESYLGQRLDGMARAGAPIDRDRVFDSVDFGEPAERILALADNVHADLVIVGTHSRSGVGHLVLGSVAEKVLRNAHCPVLVMRPKAHRK